MYVCILYTYIYMSIYHYYGPILLNVSYGLHLVVFVTSIRWLFGGLAILQSHVPNMATV